MDEEEVNKGIKSNLFSPFSFGIKNKEGKTRSEKKNKVHSL